jgi:hypothetical protein
MRALPTNKSDEASHRISKSAALKQKFLQKRLQKKLGLSLDFSRAILKLPSPVRQALVDFDYTEVDRCSSETHLGECKKATPFSSSLLFAKWLLDSLELGFSKTSAAMASLLADNNILSVRDVLTHDQTTVLKNLILDKASARPDSVDGCPDYQVNLSLETLEQLIGTSTLCRLMLLPRQLQRSMEQKPGQEQQGNSYSQSTISEVPCRTLPTYKHVAVFARMYSTQSRPFINFHQDSAAFTVNIALNGDGEYDGGELLVLHQGEMKAELRSRGEATVHTSDLLHGVRRMYAGERFSLILFFNE